MSPNMTSVTECYKFAETWQVWQKLTSVKKHAKIYQMRKNVDQKQSALYLNMVMSMYSSVKNNKWKAKPAKPNQPCI